MLWSSSSRPGFGFGVIKKKKKKKIGYLIDKRTVRSETDRLEIIIVGILEQRVALTPYFTDFTHSCFGLGKQKNTVQKAVFCQVCSKWLLLVADSKVRGSSTKLHTIGQVS